VKKRDVILNTEAHRPAFNSFAEHLDAIERREGLRPGEILNQWLEFSYRAQRAAILKLAGNDDELAKNEADYMRGVARLRHKQETMADYGSMLGALVLALEADDCDFIGPVFSALSASAGMGQFFTPWSLSKAAAMLIMPESREACAALADSGALWCHEPAAGVGGMILATNQILRERGFSLHRDVHWIAFEVDFRAMCGAYLQLNLTGSSAVVTHGNTLSLEAWQTTPTLTAVMYPKRKPERVKLEMVIESAKPEERIERGKTSAVKVSREVRRRQRAPAG
jgi:hypothetical protein